MILEHKDYIYISVLQKWWYLWIKINFIKYIQESVENILASHWNIQTKMMMSDDLLKVQTNQENYTIRCQE